MTLNLRMSKIYKTNTFLLGNSGIIPTFLKDAGVENVQTQGRTALQNYGRKKRAYLKNYFTINGYLQFEVSFVSFKSK